MRRSPIAKYPGAQACVNMNAEIKVIRNVSFKTEIKLTILVYVGSSQTPIYHTSIHSPGQIDCPRIDLRPPLKCSHILECMHREISGAPQVAQSVPWVWRSRALPSWDTPAPTRPAPTRPGQRPPGQRPSGQRQPPEPARLLVAWWLSLR